MTANDQEAFDRLHRKVAGWPMTIAHSLTTLHCLKVDEDDEDPVYAVLVHNPFNVRQFQVLAILPTLDMEVAITGQVDSMIDSIVGDMAKDEEAMEHIEEMMVCRLKIAGDSDREFAHKMIDAKFSEGDLDIQVAAKIYQEHYGLTSGGDFNRPLYGGHE